MRVTLKNQFLLVIANTKGAELNSVRSRQSRKEYLWQADRQIWGWHAPILFPIVGRLVNNQYHFNGKIYHMLQHGFARRRQFKLIHHSKDQAAFELKPDAQTKSIYPFDFDLKVTYQLINHTIRVAIGVVNSGSHSLWFSTGSHPGFNLPLDHNGNFNDYQLTVAPRRVYSRVPLRDSLNDVQHLTKIDLRRPLTLRHRQFKNDAIVLVLHHRQTTLMLSSHHDDSGVAVTVYHCPFVGIWSAYPKTGSFACIEPWWGLADNFSHHGQLTKKTAINHLKPHRNFKARFDIMIF